MIAEQESTWVVTWWVTISAISVANIIGWLVLAAERLRGRRDRPAFSTRGWQTLFSALFVLGCAFRSFLPRVEALRFCLYDSWLSSATLGRAVATIAELAFVAQWTVLLREWCRTAGIPFGVRLSRLLLPAIGLAEVFSWYSALTTNFLGSVVEESLWAINAALLAVVVAVLWLRAGDTRQRFLGTLLLFNTAYVFFMITVDVPMYWRRWKEDEAAGKPYLSLRDGWRDAQTRRIVTRAWKDWRDEVPWMSLYFCGAVWLSLGLIRAPRLEEAPPSEQSDDLR
jgi:hypothetical protein